MSEKPTCATCPYSRIEADGHRCCHHTAQLFDDGRTPGVRDDFFCNHHPAIDPYLAEQRKQTAALERIAANMADAQTAIMGASAMVEGTALMLRQV